MCVFLQNAKNVCRNKTIVQSHLHLTLTQGGQRSSSRYFYPDYVNHPWLCHADDLWRRGWKLTPVFKHSPPPHHPSLSDSRRLQDVFPLLCLIHGMSCFLFTASDTCRSETEHTYKESRCVTLWTAPFSPLVVRRVPPARPVRTQKQQPRRCNGRYQISFSPSESLDKTTQLIPRGEIKVDGHRKVISIR